VLAVLLVLQWTIGPVMVLGALPLELATAHNATAALLLLTTVALLRFLWTPAVAR
jgi:heme A synthase